MTENKATRPNGRKECIVEVYFGIVDLSNLCCVELANKDLKMLNHKQDYTTDTVGLTEGSSLERQDFKFVNSVQTFTILILRHSK